MKFQHLDDLLWHFHEKEIRYSIVHADTMNDTLGNLIKYLTEFYGQEPDWLELDKNDDFQEFFDLLHIHSESNECDQMLAIFSLDRGLAMCQINSLLDTAYDEYLTSEARTAKRMMM